MKHLLILISFLITTGSFGQIFSEIIKVVADDRESQDRFGWSVDISGNYAIVGAYADDFGGLDPNMGSAYIFEKDGIADWEFVQKIFNSDQDDYDRFGWSVAIDGDYVVVGASHKTSSTALRDRIFVEPADEDGVFAALRACGLDQAVVVSTCDRVEFHGVAADVACPLTLPLAHLAGETFEQAVLLSVGMEDTQSFQRHFAQLKPFYAEAPTARWPTSGWEGALPHPVGRAAPRRANSR